VKRLVAWLSGAAGGFALYRWLMRERTAVAETAGPDPRAQELRAKLAESRPLVDEREDFEAGETPVDEAPDPAERRRRIHEQGRSAVDEMRRSGSDEQ
jgi:hypothetical protein